MSEEKECKCCHEWWFDSDIKNDLCPNCYDYFRQLKQQLEEKNKLIELLNRKVDRYENMFRSRTMKRTGDMQKDIEIYIKQLAIQELAEVERLLYESHYKEIDNKYYAEYEDIKNLIDNRIQALEELKGE